jgi:hypothetical protein
MGFLSKIFKPVSKVLDKIIPNEIKPALPYMAAFAPMMLGPGIMGSSMAQRALMSGGMNIFGQLSQEGNEGDINLLSAGLGALSGAMTAPGTEATTARGDLIAKGKVPDFSMSAPMEGPVLKDVTTRLPGFGAERVVSEGAGSFADFTAKGIERFGADSAMGEILGGAAKASKFMTDPGLMKYGIPVAQGTGDLMFAQAKRDQDAYEDSQAADSEADAASDARRAAAIRQSMEAYGFTDEEIEDAIYAAGYKTGGRVGLEFGGIPAALENIEDDEMKDTAKFVSAMDDMDVPIMDIVEDFEIQFKRKPNSLEELKEFYKEKYDYKGPGDVRIQETMEESFRETAAEGGLMDLGGKEMDMRGGGFIPIGEKEKADDVPARLSKNEFVMTADAVRAAGGGSVNEGAKRMYETMNKLEAKA